MKNLIFPFLLFGCFSLVAQSQYNHNFDWQMSDLYNKPISYFPLEKVEHIEFTVLKNGKEKKYLKEYDSSGRAKSLYKLLPNKSGTETRIPIITVNDFQQGDQLIRQTSYFKRGKLKKSLIKRYNKDGKKLESTKTNARGKIKHRDIWSYNEQGCLQQSVRYKRNGKVHRKWAYEYYEDCEKAKTTLSKGNGKIINVWNYDCDDEGKQLVKKKDETQICQWDEQNQDFLIKVKQYFDEKGRVRKEVSKYRRADTAIVERKIFDGEDEIDALYAYDPNIKRLTEIIRYKKGEKHYELKYEYDGKKLLLRQKKIKGQIKSKYEYDYQNSLLTERKEYDKNNEVKRLVKLNY